MISLIKLNEAFCSIDSVMIWLDFQSNHFSQLLSLANKKNRKYIKVALTVCGEGFKEEIADFSHWSF